VAAFTAADPVYPTVLQSAYVQGTVLGFFEPLDVSLLGEPPSPGLAGSTTASRLKVHGTATMPSATAVIGPAWRVLAALSDLGVDRDATDTDEREQAAAAGRTLPVRDGIEPFLAAAGEAAFEADVAAEFSAAEPSYARLRPFGRQGEVDNMNARIDGDGDGKPDLAVASEAGHHPIHLDLALWRYGTLFPAYADYRRVMSRYISIPVNLSLDLAGKPADRAMDELSRAAFGKDKPAGWDDWMQRGLALEHRDALHPRRAGARGSRPRRPRRRCRGGSSRAPRSGTRARWSCASAGSGSSRRGS
jgi:hypothetical protein